MFWDQKYPQAIKKNDVYMILYVNRITIYHVVYIYYFYICIYYIELLVYIERERERKKDTHAYKKISKYMENTHNMQRSVLQVCKVGLE